MIDEGELFVYDIDRGNTLIKRVRLPFSGLPDGAVAGPGGILYVSWGGSGGSQGNGSLLAYDLVHNKTLWNRSYASGVDSMAITPNGRRIYMPAGEQSGSGTWQVIDAANGKVVGKVAAGASAHDTCMGANGRFVYLGGVDTPYLAVARTATNKVVKRIGPLHGPGVRPFTINRSQTLAFTTARSFLGFQVSSITTGKVLFNAAPPGFSFDPAVFTHTPNHGIALSPNGRQLSLIDAPNGYVHVFDVSGLPRSAPRDIANIKLDHGPSDNSWLSYGNGRYLYVGDSGDVIGTATRKIVDYLPPLAKTTVFIEIDWQHGKPVSATTSRCN